MMAKNVFFLILTFSIKPSKTSDLAGSCLSLHRVCALSSDSAHVQRNTDFSAVNSHTFRFKQTQI